MSLGSEAPHPSAAPGAGATPATGDRSDLRPPTSHLPPSYTQRLLADRNLRLKKLGEEAAELVTACADGDAARAAEEAADLVYHTLVALHAVGADLGAVRDVLARRAALGPAGRR
jgi:phosphoribosyl-ATP pyrophosphohydrolase/phosphoribosyl-AMP cyclohydrolase